MTVERLNVDHEHACCCPVCKERRRLLETLAVLDWQRVMYGDPALVRLRRRGWLL